MATIYSAGSDAVNPTLFRTNKVGRNQLCPCGSGKKAKYCHGTTTQYKYRVKNDKKSES